MNGAVYEIVKFKLLGIPRYPVHLFPSYDTISSSSSETITKSGSDGISVGEPTELAQHTSLGKGYRKKWSENTGIAKKGGRGGSDPAKI